MSAAPSEFLCTYSLPITYNGANVNFLVNRYKVPQMKKNKINLIYKNREGAAKLFCTAKVALISLT